MSEMKSKAASYLELVKSRKKTVEVTVPSGAVFIFQDPGKFAMLFGLGDLPAAATSKAVQSWQTQGVIKESDITPEDGAKYAAIARDAAQKVLALSVDPKLVSGAATNDNELSINDLEDRDVEFLLAWCMTGGVESETLLTFLEQQRANAGAGTNGAGLRAVAEPIGKRKKRTRRA